MTSWPAPNIKTSQWLRIARGAPILAALLFTALASTARAAGPERFILHEAPRELPALTFADSNGQQRTLAEFRGKVVLLNVWATWCGPCRREMPTLDSLQTVLGGPNFEVVALSIDRSGAEAVKKFYAETGVRNLGLYIDTSARAAQQLGAVGLPITVLVDRQGRERGRLIGPAEWDAPEMLAFLKQIIAEHTGQMRPGSRVTTFALSTELTTGAWCHELTQQQERRRSHA